MQILVNLVAFKIGWLACVLGGAHGMPLIGTLIALAIVALHVANAAAPARELSLVLIAGFIGAAWDSAMAGSGLLVYASGTLFAGTDDGSVFLSTGRSQKNQIGSKGSPIERDCEYVGGGFCQENPAMCGRNREFPKHLAGSSYHVQRKNAV